MIQLGMLSIVLQGWRSWKSAKVLALLAAVALAVGIGSTTAIYTVVHAVLMKPLAYQHPERWVTLFSGQRSDPGRFGSLSNPDLIDYRQRNRSFEVFGWYRPTNFNLTSPGRPQHIQGVEVTPSLAGNLGVTPIAGRWFRDRAAERCRTGRGRNN